MISFQNGVGRPAKPCLSYIVDAPTHPIPNHCTADAFLVQPNTATVASAFAYALSKSKFTGTNLGDQPEQFRDKAMQLDFENTLDHNTGAIVNVAMKRGWTPSHKAFLEDPTAFVLNHRRSFATNTSASYYDRDANNGKGAYRSHKWSELFAPHNRDSLLKVLANLKTLVDYVRGCTHKPVIDFTVFGKADDPFGLAKHKKEWCYQGTTFIGRHRNIYLVPPHLALLHKCLFGFVDGAGQFQAFDTLFGSEIEGTCMGRNVEHTLRDLLSETTDVFSSDISAWESSLSPHTFVSLFGKILIHLGCQSVDARELTQLSMCISHVYLKNAEGRYLRMSVAKQHAFWMLPSGLPATLWGNSEINKAIITSRGVPLRLVRVMGDDNIAANSYKDEILEAYAGAGMTVKVDEDAEVKFCGFIVDGETTFVNTDAVLRKMAVRISNKYGQLNQTDFVDSINCLFPDPPDSS